MANRKVVINRHTSGSTAPTASEMYLGELAVAHETGKETLFTKNNAGDMVPFISCAQTISIINAAKADVQAASNEEHLSVATAGTLFTISTNDVQSEAEFEAYSAATKTRIDNNYSAITAVTTAMDALTDIVLTGIVGDAIISATTNNPSTGTNTVNLYHKTGAQVTGFNKLDTDAYGHVTASTEVATSDIEALGFRTSADTDVIIAELSASVVTNETDIQTLSARLEDDEFVIARSLNDLDGRVLSVSASVTTLEATVLTGITATGDSYISASVAGRSAITVGLANTAATSGSAIAAASTTGSLADAKAVKEYVQNIVTSAVEYKGATTGTPANPVQGDLWIAASAFTIGTEPVEVGDFIIYDGTKWDVIQKNLDGAITGTLTPDTITLGDTVNSVKSLANGNQGDVLTMGASSPEWSTKVNSAVTSVSADTATSAQTSVSATTSYSAVTSVSAITSVSAVSATTSLHSDAATKVDSALTINILTTAGTTGSTVTFDGSQNVSVDIPAGEDTATTETGHYTPATTASSLDATAGTFINSITLDSKKHVISATTADKVNSASTSESADTADKVANALSISGYATSESASLDTTVTYDGSAAKSLTFGTNTAAGKSMSMTSAGVVDIEIIDCGTY